MPAFSGFTISHSDLAREAVARGAEMLYGAGKDIRDIDLNVLNVEDPSYCVLGQLYGSYTNGANELRFSGSPCRYGFDTGTVDHGVSDVWLDEYILHAAWAEAIANATALNVQGEYARRIAKDAEDLRAQRSRDLDELANVIDTIESLNKTRERLQKAIADADDKATTLEKLAPLVGAIEL